MDQGDCAAVSGRLQLGNLQASPSFSLAYHPAIQQAGFILKGTLEI
jgi:hypothetical protein